MKRTPPAARDTQIAESASEVFAAAGAEVGSHSEPSQPWSELRLERTEAFDACVEEIRRTYVSSGVDWVPKLADHIRRRAGLDATSVGVLALAGIIPAGLRLAVMLAATALVGDWARIPWGTWAVIVVLLALNDATTPLTVPPPDVPLGPRMQRIVEDWTALIPTIRRESDLRDLAEFTQRRLRVGVGAAVGVAVATLMLAACRLLTPNALGALPAGSIVLLAVLLYEFGVNVVFWGNLVNWSFMARESRYDHQLFWPSPADAPEVRKAIRKTVVQGFGAGLWITIYLALSVFLVSWDSPLVLPLAVGFVAIGYLVAIGQAVSSRASVRKIVERIRLERMRGLQHRIETFGPDYTELSPQQSRELRDLLFLHDTIRNAPATPAATHAVARTTAGLLLPTIAFVITVFGEVSAERFLDAILP